MRLRLGAVIFLDYLLDVVNVSYLKRRKSLFNLKYFFGITDISGRLSIQLNYNRDCLSGGFVGFEIFGYFVDLFRKICRDQRR